MSIYVFLGLAFDTSAVGANSEPDQRPVSRDLLSQCRTAASLQLACEIRWRQRHVDTKRNVADRMSRAADRKDIKKGDARRGERGAYLTRPSSTTRSDDERG